MTQEAYHLPRDKHCLGEGYPYPGWGGYPILLSWPGGYPSQNLGSLTRDHGVLPLALPPERTWDQRPWGNSVREQTHTCKNITFPILRMRAVKIKRFSVFEPTIYCVRDRCYHCAMKTRVTERLLNWTQFMLQWFARRAYEIRNLFSINPSGWTYYLLCKRQMLDVLDLISIAPPPLVMVNQIAVLVMVTDCKGWQNLQALLSFLQSVA